MLKYFHQITSSRINHPDTGERNRVDQKAAFSFGKPGMSILFRRRNFPPSPFGGPALDVEEGSASQDWRGIVLGGDGSGFMGKGPPGGKRSPSKYGKNFKINMMSPVIFSRFILFFKGFLDLCTFGFEGEFFLF